MTCKDWKIRKEAFDELKKTLQNLLTSESCMDVLAFHASLWPQYLTESVKGVLDSVLDCFNEFILKCEPDFLSAIQIPILKPMVERCLGHVDENIRNKSLNYLLVFFNIA